MTVAGGWGVCEWPEADLMFRHDPRWKGSDCAYSVALDDTRVLWLFNDTFIAPHGGPRAGTPMICNTIGVQTGVDPTSATVEFHWRDQDGEPAAFFARREDAVLWPGPGVMVGERLLLVMRWIALTDAAPPWGFRYHGDQYVLIDNPRDEPAAWLMQTLDAPLNRWGIEMGAGSLLVDGNHLLLFAPGPGNHGHLARWLVDAVARGDLAGLEWWYNDRGWVPAADAVVCPDVVLPHAQSEFSVHRFADGQWVQVQGMGVGGAALAVRWASRPEGPWSPLRPIFTPVESLRPGTFCYAFKAHPHLSVDEIVVTYASNCEVGDVAGDETLYWPRFLRVTPPRLEVDATVTSTADAVTR